MFRQSVAAHYQSKGYTVREGLRVEGHSGKSYAIEMLCEGPLGGLLVSFGDAGGIDEAELGRVKQLARDIGATPVLAAEFPHPSIRQMAARMGVVLLDANLDRVEEETPIAIVAGTRDDEDESFASHPWPASGRAADGGVTETVDVDELLERPRTVPSWTEAIERSGGAAPAPAQTTPAPAKTKFQWLGPAPAPAPLATGPTAAPDAPLTLELPGASAAATGPKPTLQSDSLLVARAPPAQRAADSARAAWDKLWVRIAFWTALGIAVVVILARSPLGSPA